LTAELFDPVPIDRMTEAENAVCEAAANIPAEVISRFESADTLSQDDRSVIIGLARTALASFQPKPESKPDAEPTSDSDPKSNDDSNTDPQNEPPAGEGS